VNGRKLRFLLIGIAVIVVSAFFDNIRGPLLPVFARDYGLSYGQAAAFFWASSVTSFLIGMISVPLLARWTERTYIRAAMLIQCLAVLCAAGGSYASLIVSGLFWGAGNTAIGMSSNLVVLRGTTDENRSRRMSALHLFYCLGAIVPAFYAAQTADRLPLPAILLPTLSLLILLWAATEPLPKHAEAAPAPQMPWAKMLAPHALVSNLLISVYILGEVLTSMWLVTYLTGQRGLSVTEASGRMQLYFLAMASSRALGIFLFRSGWESALPAPLMLASAASLSAGLAGWDAGFLLAPFFFGPMFPLLATRLVKDYPKEYPSLTAFMYAVCTILLALGHVLLGWVSDRFSLQAAYRVPSFCILAALLLLGLRSRLSPPA